MFYYKDLFGDIDAARDVDLHRCFIGLPEHTGALHPKVFSIRAYKGSGKTAYQKQLRFCSEQTTPCGDPCPHGWELCRNAKKYIVVPLDMTEISFDTLFKLSHSYNDPRLGMTDTLRHICKVYVVAYILDYLKKNNLFPEEQVALERCFKAKHLLGKAGELTKELFSTLERVFTKADKLSEYVHTEIFGGVDKYNEAYSRIAEIALRTSTSVLLVFDGFDIILDLFRRSDAERRYFYNTIVTSLIELAYGQQRGQNSGKTRFPNDSVQIKILFPEDLYNTLDLRDMQKYDHCAIEFRWNAASLKEFIGKRIAIVLGREIRRETDYGDLFARLFGKNITNTYYDQQEDTFEYALRHTMMRPRDLQEVCVSIAGEVVKKYGVLDKDALLKHAPFKPDLVKEGVKEATKEIVRYLKREFDAVNLGAILGSLHAKPNILAYGDLYNILAKAGVTTDVKETMALLLRIGIVGILREGDKKILETYSKHRVCQKGDRYYVSIFGFSYRGEVTFSTDDKLVLAPLFYDNLETKVDDKTLIYPFEQTV